MILIVDDKQENIFSLQSTLQAHGFEVDTALSGEEALKKILKNTYALIILDVQMPGMDGFEVAEAVSGYSKAKDIPIIFLSANNTDKRFITRGYVAGGIDYITKPVDVDILLLKVKTFYRLYEQTRELNKIHSELRAEIETRKRAQEAQNIKTNELYSILEAIPQIAFMMSAGGKMEYVNEQWYQYSDSKDVLPEFAAGDEHVPGEWQTAMRAAAPFSFEVRLKMPGTNRFRCHLLRVTPLLQDEQVIKWAGTFTDIHEQKMANETLEHKVRERTGELMEINKELELSNHDLQQFASVASHDLKEPLRKIQIFSSVMRTRFLKEDGTEPAQYMDRIITSAERMSKLINDLLDYSRLSAGSLFKKVDINDIIKDILIDLEITIAERQAVIQVEKIPELDVIPGQVRQIFQNIISNALKFSKKDIPPVISISAELVSQLSIDSPATPEGDYCRIVIKDNGIGFNEIYLEKIFTLFQRLNAREDYEGTGIGLAIAKKIIDKHGGIITARSEEMKGAIFIIVLPVKQEATENIEKMQSKAL